MQNPWDVRPIQKRGDASSDTIYRAVGEALTRWEELEGHAAELFDTMVSSLPSNRAAFSAYTAILQASARTNLLEAAAPPALKNHAELLLQVQEFIKLLSNFGSRRNEIAHGRVYGISPLGCYLGPNNISRNKWAKETGHAKFQFTAADIIYYSGEFGRLYDRCDQLIGEVAAVRRRENNAG